MEKLRCRPYRSYMFVQFGFPSSSEDVQENPCGLNTAQQENLDCQMGLCGDGAEMRDSRDRFFDVFDYRSTTGMRKVSTSCCG
jgi:hypothetical protein